MLRALGFPPLAAGKVNLRALIGWLRGCFLAERERWVLWVPPCFGLGIGIYFALLQEPPLWAGPAGFLAAAASGWFGRHRTAILVAAIVIGSASLGFALAVRHTADMAAPVLEKRIGPVTVTGRILSIQPHQGGRRMTLDRLGIDRINPAATPERIRLTVRTEAKGLAAGDWVRLRATLLPPPEPAAPGAYDFARAAWFLRLGAVGFAVSSPRVIEPSTAAESSVADYFAIWLARVRQDLTNRIVTALPGPNGAIAAALMTGERGAISDALEEAFRDSGLAHLLSISGLHLALIAGLLFFAVRAGLALWEPVALRYPIKKWAAVAALLGAFAYLLLSGAAVATQRAFLMAGLVLLAMLLDRNPLSMRSVGWAAVAVLAIAPEMLLNAGFQMSFAAVVALIAGYETARHRLAAWRRDAGLARRASLALGMVAFTSVIAGFATAPFAVFHFNRFVDFGLVANLIAVPLTSFWVMPWAIVAFMLMPLGLEALALLPMGWGIAGVIWTAETIAGWPGAVSLVPAMPMWGLLAITAGGLWLCLWTRRWRLLALPLLLAGALSPWPAAAPDILIDGEGRLVAVKSAEGGLFLSSARAARGIVGETWLRRAAMSEAIPWPGSNASADDRLRCDALGCIYRTPGFVVALSKESAALYEDCRAADIVVASVPVRGRCQSARLVVDRFDLWRDGAHAIWLRRDGSAEVVSVGSVRGERPWVARRGRDWDQ